MSDDEEDIVRAEFVEMLRDYWDAAQVRDVVGGSCASIAHDRVESLCRRADLDPGYVFAFLPDGRLVPTRAFIHIFQTLPADMRIKAAGSFTTEPTETVDMLAQFFLANEDDRPFMRAYFQEAGTVVDPGEEAPVPVPFLEVCRLMRDAIEEGKVRHGRDDE